MYLDERIFMYGGTGAGKTNAWLSMARANPDCTFRVIDTDKAVNRALRTEFKDLKNISLINVRNWETLDATISTIHEKKTKTPLEQKDFLVIDFLDATWEFVQDYYVRNTFGMNLDEFFLKFRQALKGTPDSLEVFSGWVDWNIIKKTYRAVIDKACYEIDCNIICTAQPTLYKESTDGKLYKNMKDSFAKVGQKPEGEKHNPFRFHTILYMGFDGNEYSVTSIKDRGRNLLNNFTYSTLEKKHDFNEMYMQVVENKIPVLI